MIFIYIFFLEYKVIIFRWQNSTSHGQNPFMDYIIHGLVLWLKKLFLQSFLVKKQDYCLLFLTKTKYFIDITLLRSIPSTGWFDGEKSYTHIF
jgi:hypothetical protein